MQALVFINRSIHIMPTRLFASQCKINLNDGQELFKNPPTVTHLISPPPQRNRE